MSQLDDIQKYNNEIADAQRKLAADLEARTYVYEATEYAGVMRSGMAVSDEYLRQRGFIPKGKALPAGKVFTIGMLGGGETLEKGQTLTIRLDERQW